ncbi:hypothetical protein L7F22_039759 [Adiantum nelumboides]|nr:hypothetical protein [Adiantum nelumboides]
MCQQETISFALAHVQVARVSYFKNDDQIFTAKPYLHHLLDSMDHALGFDLYGVNVNNFELDHLHHLLDSTDHALGFDLYGVIVNEFELDKYKSLVFLKLDQITNPSPHVLPLVIDGCLMIDVRDVIYCLGKLASFFFGWITSKEIDISSIAQKKRECIELLCLMKKELPISFFDIQVHVLIHLVDEIEIAGVVSTRLMF